jgi:hypothetical protein
MVMVTSRLDPANPVGLIRCSYGYVRDLLFIIRRRTIRLEFLQQKEQKWST